MDDLAPAGLSLPWTAKTTMVEVNGNGRPIGKPRRMSKKVGRLKPFYGDDFQFVVVTAPENPQGVVILIGLTSPPESSGPCVQFQVPPRPLPAPTGSPR